MIRGTRDDIMSRADCEAIVQIVNQAHPGHAQYIELAGMTHGATVNGEFPDELLQTVLAWSRELLALN